MARSDVKKCVVMITLIKIPPARLLTTAKKEWVRPVQENAKHVPRQIPSFVYPA